MIAAAYKAAIIKEANEGIFCDPAFMTCYLSRLELSLANDVKQVSGDQGKVWARLHRRHPTAKLARKAIWRKVAGSQAIRTAGKARDCVG
eukprot:CAMPEP_0177679658 /NCGR_PEP_ID=MMETSP0447-20121125/29724_1 /TAXON_ID=0 /ORGANISM="Stygamoeba regulata, Strain BSH-02190019" /LENGTH=89 /DNA_ID=CAMNT_0019188871 /DNA_START=165 /DNA_END=431 /DNA_ORIENTATION=+